MLDVTEDLPTTYDNKTTLWIPLRMTRPAGPPPEGILHEDWVRPEIQIPIQMLEACVLKCLASPTASDAMRKKLETLVGIGAAAPSTDTSVAASSHDAAIDSDKLVNDIWERCFSTLEYNATCNRERRQKMKKLVDWAKLDAKRPRTDGTPSDH